jgi:hypothetical protein
VKAETLNHSWFQNGRRFLATGVNLWIKFLLAAAIAILMTNPQFVQVRALPQLLWPAFTTEAVIPI